MKSLIRNCLHGNEIYIIEETDENKFPIFIVKSSSTKEGIESIINEKEGFEWYNNERNDKIVTVVETQTKYYLKAKYNYIIGDIRPYNSGFINNKKYIENIIKHYCDIWPRSKSKNNLFTIHGDLSLVNIIFCSSDQPVIIDWEHFNLFSAPLGFDALNFIFEQLWFEYEFERNPNQMINYLPKLIKFLQYHNAIDDYYIEFPLKKTIDFIYNNQKIWCGQHSKLPILNFSDVRINSIDKKLLELLR